MEQKLKELIQLSVVEGSISQEKREYIYSKASESSIDKTECDIVIDSFLNQSKKESEELSFNKKYRGWVFIIIGFFDMLWAGNIGQYDKSTGQIFMLSALVFILIGFHFQGWLNKKSATRLGIVLASYLIPYLIFEIILYLIHIPIRALGIHSLYEFEWKLKYFLGFINWIAFALFIYMFKIKLFGEELSSKINFQFLDNKLNPIKNKLPDWIK